MITLITLWIETQYSKKFDDIYIGTMILDVVGMFGTFVTLDTLINTFKC